jgi:ethanolamine utilization protein EutA (predicted chaperonin)
MARKLTEAPVIAIDDIELDQFGYVDIGETLAETKAVPVTVKSLLFEG